MVVWSKKLLLSIEDKAKYIVLLSIAIAQFFYLCNSAYANNDIDCNTIIVNSTVELGKDLFNDQKYRKAIEIYTKILKCRPDHVLSLYNRGQAYMKLDNINLAIQDYSKCIKIMPNFLPALERRAFAYFQTNRFNDSYADYEALLLKKPDDRNYLWGLFKSASGSKKHMKVIELSDVLIKKDIYVPFVFELRGHTYYQIGAFEKAVQDFNLALKSQDEFSAYSKAFIYYTKSFAEERIHDFSESLASINKSLLINLNHADSHFHRAHLNWMYFEDYGSVINDFRKCIELKPDKIGYKIHFSLFLSTCPRDEYRNGMMALEILESIMALEILESISVPETKKGQYYNALAAAHAELGDFTKAIQNQRKSIEMMDDIDDDKSLMVAKENLKTYKSGKPLRIQFK